MRPCALNIAISRTRTNSVPHGCRALWRGAFIALVALLAIHTDAGCGDLPTSTSIVFESTSLDGGPIVFAVNITGPDNGTITETGWKKGKDRSKDRPNSKKTTKVYDAKARADGTMLVGKADVPLKDPTLTFILSRQNLRDDSRLGIKRRAIFVIVRGTTFGLKDRTTRYIITEEEHVDLCRFLKDARLPRLGAVP